MSYSEQEILGCFVHIFCLWYVVIYGQIITNWYIVIESFELNLNV